MKLAIHSKKGSFSDDWIEYCKEKNVQFKLVDCYSSSIIDDLRECDGLMWHWHHTDPKAVLFAKQLTFSLEKIGIKVFPSSSTSWHFDDKVGQKYLFEAIGIPLVPSHVFYDKKTAFDWIHKSTFPKVFKLRGGSSAVNVKLVKSARAAEAIVRQAFGRGFSPKNRQAILEDRLRVFKKKKDLYTFYLLLRGVVRYFIPTEFEKLNGPEKGYVYFQDFIEGNTYDTRVVVVGNKCFAIRRYNRENDFRASGSGNKHYDDPKLFDINCIRLARETTKQLNAQSLAFDFLVDKDNKPLIVEISYCFTSGAFPGYWDEDDVWHNEKVNVRKLMIEEFIKILE
ncbi:hypothetical protein [uncultured Pontibacter sp.]|uniref:ATP-grasp domain-containing protein n=1 Tax=uncultured Pontibacter sp. TaxID=453356 RepID=UPI002637BEC4|nr:hypothetical protein [uncultured Pontibacter sp.]